MNKEKIGVGIITCNRPEYLKSLMESLSACSFLDEVVIINDGKTFEYQIPFGTLINNPSNLGVAKTKNKAFKFLLEKNCDYIFLIEDDLVVADTNVFLKYINASKITGIQHFNFGPGTPFNRKQNTRCDLDNRHELNQTSEPNPKIIIEYPNDVKCSFYEHVAGLFSFYTKQCLEEVGLMDEQFFNAWEHVAHTYDVIKKNMHPPFWWFADIFDSHKMLSPQPDSIKKSETAKNKDEWLANVIRGRELYKQKYGIFPNEAPLVDKDVFLKTIKTIKNKK
jgi:glycosyltransferase involved in cell wall biosynthesis